MNKEVLLFVMHELSVGGAERVVSNLVNNLDREKFDIHLCLFKRKGALVETLADDITLHDLKASRVITAGHKLFWLILRLKPDVVFSGITHVNLLIGSFIPFLRPFCIHTRFVTREVNIPSARAEHLSRSKRLDRFYRHFIHNFDFIIAQSDFMKRDIIRSYGVDENSITVVNNPIDFKVIEHSLHDEKSGRALLETDKTTILAVGNLRRQKGFDILLRTMTLLNDGFHLYILGEGKERTLLEKMIDELNLSEKVTLLGFHKNPYIHMKNADMVVLSSRYEGFPNVILEANACGRFVIAFECPGVSHEIIENNVNGLLVECGNDKELAEAIEKYADIVHDEDIIKETTARYRVGNIVKAYEKVFLKLKK
ncbi:MAG: hypothetical protein BV458_10690 [Thermoplasmata archaeon M9B2D]|nr:MAG: hypothetical protein BV458_10690 [Thermoplasmata archaeon M9B2D]